MAYAWHENIDVAYSERTCRLPACLCLSLFCWLSVNYLTNIHRVPEKSHFNFQHNFAICWDIFFTIFEVPCSGKISTWYTLCLRKKRTNFETVWLEIIRIDFDNIWQKYSKYSRIEFACFSFPVGLLSLSTFRLSNRTPKICKFWRCIKQMYLTNAPTLMRCNFF